LEPVDAEQLDRRLRDAHTLLPISPVAMEIVALSEAGGTPKAYSELVRCDATLTAGVLRAANSVFFNPGGKPVVEIEEAVLRLGDKRLMEIALGSAVLQSITSQSTPGFDVRLAWRRGLAAAVATELISEQADEGSLFLCALVHNLGRLILARLFPQHYAAMIETAAAKGCSLEEQERRCFANSPLAALAGVVQAWNLPIEVTAPLRLWAGDDELSNDWTPRLRRQVKTLRLASEVGVYAVGQWEPWERISLQDSAFGETSHKVAARWISETQRRLADSLSGADSRRRTPRSTATDSQRMEIVYERRRTHSADPLELLLESLGFSLVEAPPRPRRWS
jgi:HD-like signal output (HDOD) protein